MLFSALIIDSIPTMETLVIHPQWDVEKDARSQRKKVANDLLVNYVAKEGKKVTTYKAHKQNAIIKTRITKNLTLQVGKHGFKPSDMF